MIILALAGAAAIAAPTRYLLDGFVQRRVGGVFPWGTWTINITGTFLLGLLTGLAAHHDLTVSARTVLGSGFCGAYTTFSTFSYETIRLAEDGAYTEALLNVGSTLAVGLLAAATGLLVAAALV